MSDNYCKDFCVLICILTLTILFFLSIGLIGSALDNIVSNTKAIDQCCKSIESDIFCDEFITYGNIRDTSNDCCEYEPRMVCFNGGNCKEIEDVSINNECVNMKYGVNISQLYRYAEKCVKDNNYIEVVCKLNEFTTELIFGSVLCCITIIIACITLCICACNK